MKKNLIEIILGIVCLLQITTNHSLAQIIPDNTLGSESSKINSLNELRDRIEGGAVRGENLFHSFEEFNVPEGFEVYFANPEQISNIFSRITGSNISEIFGTLGVEGTANLFLINPNGIVFGQNAVIDIGGSFIATTAEAVEFEDGNSFKISTNDSKPILTSNIPIGLSITEEAGDIEVRGLGHNLLVGTATPTIAFPAFSSLSVKPENTIALVGGNIISDGGVLNAPDGHIELGAVVSGKVFFDSSLKKFSYEESILLKDILLDKESLLNVSGSGGSINSISDRLSLKSGSGFFVQNQREDSSNNNKITIEANALNILGGSFRPAIFFENGFVSTDSKGEVVRGGVIDGQPVLPGISVSNFLKAFGLNREDSTSEVVGFTPSLIYSETLKGEGNDIEVNANKISIEDGAQLISRGFGNGNLGEIKVESSSIEIKGVSGTPGFAEQNFEINSQISTYNFGSGSEGNIEVNTTTIFVSDRGSLNSVTGGTGRGGNVLLDAERVEITGVVPNLFIPASISTSTIGKGNAGKLSVFAKNILLLDGAGLSSVTFAEGDAGEVFVEATESIEVKGIDSFTGFSSDISGNAVLLPQEIREAFLLPSFPTGRSGKLTVIADTLSLLDGGGIGVLNQGTGDAGNLEIKVNSLIMKNDSIISAQAVNGAGGNIFIESNRLVFENSEINTLSIEKEGGNININADTIVTNNSVINAESVSSRGGNVNIESDRVRLFDSTIKASALNEGNSGNVFIEANTVLGINSDISATAVTGEGGNITIDAEGVLGFAEATVIPDNNISEIDASSEFGQDGTVTITNPLSSSSDPLIFIREIQPRNNTISLSYDCDEAGEALVTDGRSTSFSDAPGEALDTVEYYPEETTEQEEIIEDLTWQENEPYVRANEVVVTEDGRVLLVNKSQLKKFVETHNCSNISENTDR